MLEIVGGKYNNLIMYGDKCYGFLGLFKNEDLGDKIKKVEVLNKDNKGYNVIRATGATTIGALLGGLTGALASVIVNRKRLCVQFVVFTDIEGEEFLVETDNPSIIDYLYLYVENKRRNKKK